MIAFGCVLMSFYVRTLIKGISSESEDERVIHNWKTLGKTGFQAIESPKETAYNYTSYIYIYIL